VILLYAQKVIRVLSRVTVALVLNYDKIEGLDY
jgi:hypothetical protein